MSRDQLNMFLAGVGHICLQWALLEQSLLAIIAAAEDMPLEKTYTRYGTTDMMPRLRMAIRLVEEAKWPHPLQKKLKGIRERLQKGNLAERRNLFVHGVHKGIQSDRLVQLTMVRWNAQNREQIVSISEAADLAGHLATLAREAGSIFDEYGAWKFGHGSSDFRTEHVAKGKPVSRLVQGHQISAAVRSLLRRGK